ncbi:MmgE/PrpD family protein [Streptomyces sp. NPDC051219]|uniref:MmgE/PrpD family protein n=1 Tax=Streptomyces sp. NPDC051219 TaxID=3155283 RepID=UPI003429EFC5
METARPQAEETGQAASTAPHPTTAGLLPTLAAWAGELRYDDIPERLITIATSQVLSYMATARAALDHPIGAKLVTAFGAPRAAHPEQTAYVLAGLSSCLYLEDTFYAGHLSHSTVSVPLAYQGVEDADGRTLITAVVAANECAARLTAAATLGPFRGQSAAHTHLIGAPAARLRMSGRCDPAVLCNAWGLALAAPPWSLRPAFLGSEAKALSAAVPVRAGLDAAAAARAGLTGLPDLLERPGGFLETFSHAAIPEAVTHSLGRRWHTETISFKTHPTAVHLDAPVECASAVHEQLRGTHPDEIATVDVYAPRLMLEMNRHVAPYMRDGDSPIAALNLSAPYNIATVLLTGGLEVADVSPPAVHDPRRWTLAKKVRLHYDEKLSRSAMYATAPVGEALRQAGARALQWMTRIPGEPVEDLVAQIGLPASTFEDATKQIGARLVVRLTDGRTLTAERAEGGGSVGSASWTRHPELVREKLHRTGVPQQVVDRLSRLPQLTAGELADALRRSWAA